MSFLSVQSLRGQMQSCCPDAHCRIGFGDDEKVTLCWVYNGGWECHQITFQLGQLSIANRVFQRKMHEAKRFFNGLE